MPWRGPEHEGEYPSLGWQILGWFETYLPSPADETKPFILTDQQATVLLRWYGIDPEMGKFFYRRGDLEMAKGWGKSPFMGGIALAEFAAPVLFDGWDARGEPVARPWGTGETPPPWVQIAAVSEDQTDNTYSAMYEMLTANEHKAAIDLGIDEGRSRLYLHGKPGRLEPVSAAAGSREGQRVTFGVLDETFLWTPTNGGTKLARTLRRNAAKMGGRTFDTTNAPNLGEKSVAELTSTEAAGTPGILYYNVRPEQKPESDWTDEQLIDALGVAYGNASWIDLGRLVKEIRDPETLWEDALRFFFNIPTPSSERWLEVGAWPKLAEPKKVPEKAKVALAFAGSYGRQAAGIVGCTPDGYVFVVDAWEAKGTQVVSRSAVNAAITKAMSHYNVSMLGCENGRGSWDTDIEDWQEAYGVTRAIGWEVSKRAKFTEACGKFFSAVSSKQLRHDGDARLSRHLDNAHPKRSPDGESTYITEGLSGPATLAKAAVIAWELGFAHKDKEPLVAWV
jgi:hypothetical protein